MAKRPKPIKRHTPKYFFCNNCGKGLTPANIIWSWKEGPAMYCSEACKNKMENPNGKDKSS